MIQLTCPNCGVKLRAKAALVGKARRCPKCGAAVHIPPAEGGTAGGGRSERDANAERPVPVAAPAPEQHAEPAVEEPLRKPQLPDRLNRHHHYLICSASKLVATWENNAQGWQIETGHGLASAARNAAQLPNQGDFRLVELQLETTDHGRRLTGLRSYRLAPRWALPALARGDDDIMSKIVEPAGLDREQKNVVRTLLRNQFMPEVWHESKEVLDYLGNTDYHSPGTG
jgi:hypothetical protein